MRFLIQRVNYAKVVISEEVVGQIGKGLLVLVGISNTDTRAIADKMMKKLIGLRIFEDSNGKTNLDLRTIDGELLLVSQFTLYADCRKGNRPSFIKAGTPETAFELYEYLLQQCKLEMPNVQSGRFGADMKIDLQNDGPFTILLDSEECNMISSSLK